MRYEKNGNKHDWMEVCVAGKYDVKRNPLFSSDSKYLFISVDYYVNVFSVWTGKCIQRLGPHASHVKDLGIESANPHLLIACTQNGILTYWDYTRNVVYKEFDLGKRLERCLMLKTSDAICLLRSTREMVYMPLKSEPGSFSKIGRFKREDGVALGCHGDFVAWVRDDFKVEVYIAGSGNTILPQEQGTVSLGCIAAHPSKMSLAFGLRGGQIILWRNFDKSKTCQKTILHWHSSPVKTICFNPEVDRLYSGGEENTLVEWNFDGSRKKLPRLESGILIIVTSDDGMFLTVRHRDNSFSIINCMQKRVPVQQGLVQHVNSYKEKTDLPTGIVLDPRTGSLVMNGKPGHLQFYFPAKDELLFSLDVTGLNRSGDEAYSMETDVRKVAFDSKGNWLATVESKYDTRRSLDIKLKFWIYHSEKQNYILNTFIERPHNSEVTTVKFQPTTDAQSCPPLLVSCGLDKRFKIWTLNDDSDIYESRQNWTCQSVAYYQEQVPSDADFSEDGSVLAIAFGVTATLWIPESTTLQAALSHPYCSNDIRHLKLGRGSCSHLLVCSTKTELLVWDVFSLSVDWCVPLRESYLVKDYFSENMAVFADTTLIAVFKPSEPKPIFTYTRMYGKIEPITHAIFMPKTVTEGESQSQPEWQEKSILYYLDLPQALYCLHKRTTGRVKKQKNEDVVRSETLLTPFGQLFSNAAILKQMQTGDDRRVLPETNARLMEQLINAPSNTLPPVSVMCEAFFKTLLPPKTEKSLPEINSRSVKTKLNERKSESDMETETTEVNKSEKKAPVDDAVNMSMDQHIPEDISRITTDTFRWFFEKSAD